MATGLRANALTVAAVKIADITSGTPLALALLNLSY
jgi:hypothetical protein